MIHVEEIEGRVVLKPDFDIVASRVSEIRDTILKVAGPHKQLILDFNDVALIDSMGIGVVVACLKTVKQMDGDLKVDTSNEDIIKLFKLLKIEYIFE